MDGGMRDYHWGGFSSADQPAPPMLENRNLNLQLMSPASDCDMKPPPLLLNGSHDFAGSNVGRGIIHQQREAKPFSSDAAGISTEYLQQQQMLMNFAHDGWYRHHELHHLHHYGYGDGRMHYSVPTASGVSHNQQFGFVHDMHCPHQLQMVQPVSMIVAPSVAAPMQTKEEPGGTSSVVPVIEETKVAAFQEVKTEEPGKKRGLTQKIKSGSPKPKKQKKPAPKKEPKSIGKDDNGLMPSHSKMVKNVEINVNGIDIDLSQLPTPVCSCTGKPQQCYRWGAGGWQSACCTTTISSHPLPMSTKRRGSRIPGRKMSLGAFKKVLERLCGEGFNLDNPIDLRTFWAKHGTNKFVTIR